jgi:hypothetical protein
MPTPRESLVNDLKQLVTIMNQDKLVEVIADLADAEKSASPDFERAMTDPKGFLDKQGLKLPPGATVKISKNSPFEFAACLNEHCISIKVDVKVM